MRIQVERFPVREDEEVHLAEPATGLDLLRALGLAPDAHILARSHTPIPLDEVLSDGDRIRLISVVSGGSA
ncbi:MAG: hypothetical protein A3K68_06035 [Euryarchaeota archaeon RBG_16_68_13]|nr:MAG: hypothetical protein A3K68_06035 [Euryarchaeota archaeon RBG_16_68_13]